MKAPRNQRYITAYITAGGLALLVALAAVIGSVDSTTSFRVCFGVLLFIICAVQLKVAADLYKHRNNLLLQLFQPDSLSLFVAAGAIASIASLLFAFPEFDATCALRQPIILTSITFMGNLLIGRAWRIGSIISSTTTFAASADEIDTLGMARLKVMNVLSTLSQLGRYVRSCGREKIGTSNSGIRRAITFADSIFVVMVLLFPQLVLQIVNLSVPSVRMGSVEILEGVGEGHYTCETRAGPYVLIVGILLAAIPFGISLLINMKSKGIPDNFRELDDIVASMTSSFWVLLATLPTVGMIGQTQPNAHAYLLAASVLSFVIPLSYNIAQTRLRNIVSTGHARDGVNSKERSPIPKMQSTRTSSDLSSSSQQSKRTSLILKAAEETAIMGKMFDTMGSTSKAVAMNRDILTLFKAEGDDFSWETGFTLSEIHSLGPKSLEIVVKTLIGSAKLWHSIFRSNPDNEESKRRGIKCCIDALDIFDRAPAKKQLSDRRVIFPGYSFMNVIAKMMTYVPPNNMSHEEFELSMGENFVKETQYQQYHQCRALAFQADVMKRHGKYEAALSVIDVMKTIYDPQLHSRVLVKEYVSDHCLDLIAASTYWLHHYGRNDEALQLCDQVVDTMLPEIEATELVTKHLILIPICRTLAHQRQTSAAKKALELYRTHVFDPAALVGGKGHPALGMRVPLMIVLKCCSSGGEAYTDLSTDVVYMLNRNDPVWFEISYLSYVDAAWSTLCAEACLCLAKMTGCISHDESSALIKEGLKCLEVSANTLEKENGTIVNRIAHSYYSQILSELENLSAPV
eukprot:scaffold8397_cov104-Skeletonema_dohrnii-CCMP3373.AAC.2